MIQATTRAIEKWARTDVATAAVRMVAALLAFVVVCVSPCMAYADASGHTQEEAVAYLNSLVGQNCCWNDSTTDCVDVAQYYYDWLGVGARKGNGCAYATGNCPDGWTRVYSDPQPGDVATWDSYHNVSTSAGHVACVVEVNGNTITTVEQSTNRWKKAGRNVPCFYATWKAGSPSSYLRPNFRRQAAGLPDYNYGADGHTLVEGDGVYTIASAIDPRYFLDVAGGSKDAGANVQLYAYNGTGAQLWRFTANGDGTYTIANVGSGLCLDVDGASTEAGANVKQWSANGSNAQRWWLEDAGDGTFALKAVCSGGFLDVKDAVAGCSTNVQQWYGNGNAAQKWILSKRAGSLASLPKGDGIYVVRAAANPSLCLDVRGASTDNGANVWLYEDNSSAAQRFRFTRNADGSYCIANEGSGLLLDIAERSRLDGANCQQWGKEQALHRSFWLEELGDGSYAVKVVHSGCCLDINGGQIASGTNVQQWRSNNTAAQKWIIEKAE